MNKPTSAIKKQKEHILKEWHKSDIQSFGIYRWFKLILLAYPFITIGLYVRWLSGKKSWLCRKIAVDTYALFNLILPFIVLGFGWHHNVWVVLICAYFAVETLMYLVSLVFQEDLYSQPASYKRSIFLIFLNYIQMIADFAVFYLYSGGLCYAGTCYEDAVVTSRLDALYYSVVAGTTTGFGDISPCTPVAKFLFMIQSLTFLIFLTLIFSHFISHLSDKTYPDKIMKSSRKDKAKNKPDNKKSVAN